jgi:hypothetical protein
MQSIADLISQFNKNFSSTTVVGNVTTPNLNSISISAKRKSKRPLAKLQYILLSIIKEDCRIQGYCNRSIEEFQNLSAHSRDGVRKALKILNDGQYIFTKKQTRGYNSVRVISREGMCYKRSFKKAPQKAPHKDPTLYKISYSSSEKEKTDLLARDSILKSSKREEEAFKALGFNELDELVIVTALRRRHLSAEARFQLANTIMASHYKRIIQSPRAYYLAAIENTRG